MTMQLLLCSQKYDRTQMFHIQTLQFTETNFQKRRLHSSSVHFRSGKLLHTVVVGQEGHHEAPPLIPFPFGVGVHVIAGRSSARG